MSDKAHLLSKAFELTDWEKRRELMIETLDADCTDIPEDGYDIQVSFHITRRELIEHKADNRTHISMTPSQQLIEMIQDNLYQNGSLFEGDFTVLSCEPHSD